MAIPRGVRNNNPGCLRMAGTNGKRDKGKFAIFDTLEEGYYALNSCLYRIYDHRTLREIFKVYAPASEKGNRPGRYSKMVSETLKKMGYHVGVNTPLDLSDPNIRAAVVVAISKVECGKVLGGVDFAMAQSRAYKPTLDSRKTPTATIRRRTQRAGLAKRSGRMASPVLAKNGGDGVEIQSKKTNLDQKIMASRDAPIRQTHPTAFANKKEEATPQNGVQGISYWGLIASPRLGGATNENIQQLTHHLVENRQHAMQGVPKRLSWFKRVFPAFLGGASVEDKLLNKAYYPDGKNLNPKMVHVFQGVSVGELLDAGFSQDKIKDMQQRIATYSQQMGLKERLGQHAQIQMTMADLDITKEELALIQGIQRARTPVR